MTTPGLPPLFGAPWERQEKPVTGQRDKDQEDAFFDGLNRRGLDWGSKQLIRYNPSLTSEVAWSLATAIGIMNGSGQAKIAGDLFAVALLVRLPMTERLGPAAYSRSRAQRLQSRGG